jgi:uncharacterized protein
MHPHLESRRRLLSDLCRRHDVSRLEVFGSASGDDFDPLRSDVDLLVEFHTSKTESDPLGEYFGLKAQLEAVLDRPVDLLVLGAVKNPYLQARIENSKQLVYAA